MKKVLRKELKANRDSVENKDKLDSVITEKFISSSLYKNADMILLYYSVGSEVSTHQILKKAADDGKSLAFPVCTDSEGTMKFYIIKDEKDLTEGMYGIKSPNADCTEFIESKNALCVVPAIAFDKKGYRIGYGKGYYDRYLASFNGITVGLCYDQLVRDSLPHDIYDKKVNYLITDKKTYNFKS